MAKQRNWATRIGGSITIVLGMIVTWFSENQESLTDILSAKHMIYLVLIISAFNVILSVVEKQKKPATRKSVNAKAKKKVVDAEETKSTE